MLTDAFSHSQTDVTGKHMLCEVHHKTSKQIKL